jgi:bleomycin hydrolase
MRYSLGLILAVIVCFRSVAQTEVSPFDLVSIRQTPHTPVKNQANSGTCWSFSTVSLLESQALRAGLGEFDLSEMFIVRNIYIDKARNYLLRQGAAQFGPGGLGHDVINAVSNYGIVPESVFSGLPLGKKSHDHGEMDKKLKLYLDSLLDKRPLPGNWVQGYERILNDYLGVPPSTFTYKEKTYTPRTFAKDVLKFKRDDYVFITSFTHAPYYKPFILQIPDNYANESYYNVPLNELLTLAEESLNKGYSFMWNADISNTNFRHKDGYAMLWKDSQLTGVLDPDADEAMYDPLVRQQLFENLTTQDDHLMHVVGIEKTKKGKKFFNVKNSWGSSTVTKGYVKVSEAYFAINTMTLIIPKSALSSTLKGKLNISVK